jgi:hypothetical protein
MHKHIYRFKFQICQQEYATFITVNGLMYCWYKVESNTKMILFDLLV